MFMRFCLTSLMIVLTICDCVKSISKAPKLINREHKVFKKSEGKYTLIRFKYDDKYDILLVCSDNFPSRSTNLLTDDLKCYIASHKDSDDDKSLDILSQLIEQSQIFKVLFYATDDQVLDFKSCNSINHNKNEILITIIYGKKAVLTINTKDANDLTLFSINNFKFDYNLITCQDSEFINHSGWYKMKIRWPEVIESLKGFKDYSSLQFYEDN